MSSYTKYHQKYHRDNKDKINHRRMKKYYFKNYGIPMDRNDLIDAFREHKHYYLKLKHIAQHMQHLNPELVEIIMKK